MVITFSHALSLYGPVLLVTGLVAVWLRQYGRRRVQWVRRLERWQLGWPWVGELIRSVVVARWTQTLSALLSAGIPLVEALGPVAAACDHSVYARASETMRDQVAQGISLNECMANSRLFPSWVVQMCAIGEETGSVDDMLARAGEMLESEVQDRLAGLSSVLEPAIMVVLGLVIGGILVAMYLPIFQLGQVV
jgi:type IV pilus assembly protein PilC